MSSEAQDKSEQITFTHPRCPICAVAMWLLRIERRVDGDAIRELQHFKCMACDAEAIIPSLDG